jgi:TRAP-type C4-dicarboxylate transport system permease small subunit
MSDTTAPPSSLAHRFELAVLTILGLAATVIMFANAVLRYFLGSSLIWSEEVIRLLFVWAMFIAITSAFFRNEHIGFGNLVKKGRVLPLVHRAVYALCLLGVGAILAFHGYRYNAMTGAVRLAATNLPTSLFMWPGIVAGAVWALLGLYRLAQLAMGELRGRTP